MDTIRAIPLSLYVHVPWCVRKCPYCDFNSHALNTSLPESSYIDALLADLEADLPWIWGRAVHSIFIGGGTPSLLSPDAIERLLSGIRARCRLTHQAEITLEANPGTIEQGRFQAYRQAGINRLSLGIQSFDDHALQQLGRIHSAQDSLNAIDMARDAGFAHLNLDLMFALPDQTLSAASRDLQQAIACEPTHLSYYQLTIEPNTWFYHQRPTLPTDEQQWQMQQQGSELLETAGYHRYEVSAYAKPDNACRHNLNYWQFGDYLGIGAGAHGKLTRPDADEILRTSKFRQPQQYLEAARQGDFRQQTRSLTAADLRFEFLLNTLRLTDGFSLEAFENRTGLPAATLQPELNNAIDRGVLRETREGYCCTAQGFAFLNDILETFLPGE